MKNVVKFASTTVVFFTLILGINPKILAEQFEEKIAGAYFLEVKNLADDQNFPVPVYVVEGGVFKEGYVIVVGQPAKSQVCFKNFSNRYIQLLVNGVGGPVLEPVPTNSKKDVTVCTQVTYTPNKSGKNIVDQVFSGREVTKKD